MQGHRRRGQRFQPLWYTHQASLSSARTASMSLSGSSSASTRYRGQCASPPRQLNGGAGVVVGTHSHLANHSAHATTTTLSAAAAASASGIMPVT